MKSRPFHQLESWWLARTSLDLRALALMRIFLGLLMAYIHLQYLIQIDHFFTANMVFPHTALPTELQESFFFSLHLLSGNFIFQVLLSLAGIFLSLLFAAGCWTKRVLVLCWYLLASAQFVNPLILQGGDVQLRLILLFSLFLPIEEWLSWDRRKIPTTQRRTIYESWANTGFILQISFIYWMSAFGKMNGSWLNGLALGEALQNSSHSTLVGLALFDFINPWGLGICAAAVLGIELLAPVSVWLGWRARMSGAICLVLLHMLFALGLTITTFPWIAASVALALLPSESFERKKVLTHKNSRRSQTWVNALPLSLIFVVGLINLATLWPEKKRLIWRPLKPVIDVFQLQQNWNFFSRAVGWDWGFFRLIAVLPDGRVWGYFEEDFIDISKIPNRPSQVYPSMEWRRLLHTLIRRDDAHVMPLGPSLCQRVRPIGAREIVVLQYYRRISQPSPPSAYAQREIMRYSCVEDRIVTLVKKADNEAVFGP